MNKQLSLSDNNPTDDFVDNSEHLLKDTVKVLHTCMATLTSTIDKHETKQNQPISEQPNISTSDNQQSSIVQEKELIIDDLNNKYQQLTKILDQNNEKYKEELT